MQPIIAPTDFLSISRNAVAYAADMAAAVNAELIVLHVFQLPVTISEVPLTEFEYKVEMGEAVEQLEVLKKELLVRTGGRIIISTKIVVGSIEHTIEEMCTVKKPFAVVMGTEKSGRTERFFLGSSTLTAIKHLQFPVFVIPPGAIFKAIRNVALATDLEDADTFPTQLVGNMLGVFNASLHLVHVIKNDTNISARAISAFALQKQLAEFHPRIDIITNKKTEDGISEFVKEHHEDVVMVIPKKHNFFDSLLHTSQSRKIALDPSIPVISLPCQVSS